MLRKPAKTLHFIPLMAILLLLYFSACQKKDNVAPPSNNTNTSTLQLYLTDDPADYQSVWIDLQKISILVSNDSTGNSSWQDVSLIRPGSYDLLNFRNGEDTLLAAADISSGTLSAIRLALGDDNSLVLKDGESFPLFIPSGAQNVVDLQVENVALKSGDSAALVLDFDAARSILEPAKRDSDQFVLIPVIHAFAKGAGASLDGWVYPDAAHVHVLAVDPSSDTLATIPDNNGFYKFWGIPEGSYKLLFLADPSTGYHNGTLQQIQAIQGQVVHADTVRLHQ